MTRGRSQRGMTLVEVLIAVSLAALLAGGLAGTLGQSIRTMEASDRRIAAARRNDGVQRILEQQVAGFLPVIAPCGIAVGQRVDAPFFQGAPSVTRFVTTYSLTGAARGGPRIVEWFFAPGEGGQGVRLLLNEYPYAGAPSAGLLCMPPVRDSFSGLTLLGFPPPAPREGTFVLADKLDNGRLSYLEPARDDRPPRWVSVWSLMDVWPVAIRAEFRQRADQASSFSPVEFTGRIRISMPPGEAFVPR